MWARHLDTFAPLCEELLAVSVPSNHGEFRSSGKGSITDKARDNKDLMLSDMVAELAPFRWKNLEVIIPPPSFGDPYLATFQTSTSVDARTIGVIHGHQAKTGGPPMQKLEKWWQNAFTTAPMRPEEFHGVHAEACDILTSGHHHHFGVSTTLSRTLISFPAGDLGSGWFEQSKNVYNPQGLLCYTVDEQHPALIDRIELFHS